MNGPTSLRTVTEAQISVADKILDRVDTQASFRRLSGSTACRSSKRVLRHAPTVARLDWSSHRPGPRVQQTRSAKAERTSVPDDVDPIHFYSCDGCGRLVIGEPCEDPGWSCTECGAKSAMHAASATPVDVRRETFPDGRRVQARACIFCGSTPVTREHVWPQWLSRRFPDSPLNWPNDSNSRPLLRQRAKMVAPGSWVSTEWEDEKGQGNTPAEHVVKAACRDCNSGWMSRLEVEAAPIIVRQMWRRRDQLTDSERHILLRWLAKTTAIYEMDDPGSAVLTDAARASIMDSAAEFDDDWRFGSGWLRAATFQRGHFRRWAADPFDGEIMGYWMVQTIQLGYAVYTIRYRTTDRLEHAGLRGIRQKSLAPIHDAHERRPIVRARRWNQLLGGGDRLQLRLTT